MPPKGAGKSPHQPPGKAPQPPAKAGGRKAPPPKRNAKKEEESSGDESSTSNASVKEEEKATKESKKNRVQEMIATVMSDGLESGGVASVRMERVLQPLIGAWQSPFIGGELRRVCWG